MLDGSVPGSLIGGRYRLERLLGEGGMGTVWSAMHTVTQRAVALKFLKNSSRQRADLRQRFLREASAASALQHPNVVHILDVFDLDDQTPVLVMELLRGETLGSKLARDEQLSLEETAALLIPVFSAVGSAHAIGILHRDLKPENIFLSEVDGVTQVKVLDFGIAKLSAEQSLARGLATHLTDTNAMLGTPCYMAPEQATGDRVVDHRADIWSLGVILYECLSGTRPIEGENFAQVVARLVSAGIIPLERLTPTLPHDVPALVMRMLARDPGRRPANLIEVSKLFGSYARVEAPEFGVPSNGARPAPVAPHRLVSEGTPRKSVPPEVTLLSTPAVGNSVAIERKSKPSPRKRVRSAALGILVLGTLGLTALSFFRSEKRTDEEDVLTAHRSDAGQPTTAQASVHKPVASDVPAPTPSSANADTRPGSIKPKASSDPAVVRPKRSQPNLKRALPLRSFPVASADTRISDEVLFSGRK